MKDKYSYVYILTDDNNDKLYIGVTSDLIKRIYEHKNQQVSGYAKRNNIHKLVYYQEFGDIYLAISREKQLKGWKRDKKDDSILDEPVEFMDHAMSAARYGTEGVKANNSFTPGQKHKRVADRKKEPLITAGHLSNQW